MTFEWLDAGSWPDEFPFDVATERDLSSFMLLIGSMSANEIDSYLGCSVDGDVCLTLHHQDRRDSYKFEDPSSFDRRAIDGRIRKEAHHAVGQAWKVSSQPRNEIGVDALGQADTMIS